MYDVHPVKSLHVSGGHSPLDFMQPFVAVSDSLTTIHTTHRPLPSPAQSFLTAVAEIMLSSREKDLHLLDDP